LGGEKPLDGSLPALGIQGQSLGMISGGSSTETEAFCVFVDFWQWRSYRPSQYNIMWKQISRFFTLQVSALCLPLSPLAFIFILFFSLPSPSFPFLFPSPALSLSSLPLEVAVQNFSYG